MEISDINPFADGLVITASLPLSWSERELECPDNGYTRIAEHNEHVLRCVNLLGEQMREKVEEEVETDSAIIRLEAKVNLLLELVSRLEQRINQTPEVTDIRLASGGVEWGCHGTPPDIGLPIWVYLHIDNRVPEAMKIPARVMTVVEDADKSTVVAGFEALGEMVQELLEKMIFRHHRRMIAQSRAE